MNQYSKDPIINCASDLGVLVRQKRKQLKINQTDLAGLCNVGTRFISELENGKPTLEFDKVIKVANNLGLNLLVRER